KVLVIEQHYIPGGCCTSIRRHGIAFDVGASMLFGWAEKGYKPHRYVMNELEEEIDMIPNDSIYRMHFLKDKEVTFWRDFDRYLDELVRAFPNQEKELRALYKYLTKVYSSVVLDGAALAPPTEMSKMEMLKAFFKSPVGMTQVALTMNKTIKDILDKYKITDPNVVGFFSMLIATFFTTNVEETPGLMAPVLFVDTHKGGACYPAGSPQMLPNKLEKAIEKYGGQILYRHLVDEILIENGKAIGVRLADNTIIKADRVVSDATVWNLYGKLIKPEHIDPERLKWAQSFVPTLSTMILYIGVDGEVIPKDFRSKEAWVGDIQDFSKDTYFAFIPSIDDPSICPSGKHSLSIITPLGDEKWPRPWDPVYQTDDYNEMKQQRAEKALDGLEKYIPNLRKHIEVMEVATPSTIERFTLKNWGNVGGPKQMMGQDIYKRPRARCEFKNLYLVGDSTALGEGVVSATSSAIGAANMILKDLKMKQYTYYKQPKNYVNFVKGTEAIPLPALKEALTDQTAKRVAAECQLCEDPKCMKSCPAGIDALNFLRRIEAGNYNGAARSMRNMNPLAEICGYICPAEKLCQKECNRLEFSKDTARIADLQAWVCGRAGSEGFNAEIPERNQYKIAVIGAGPAGISCAHFLARIGYTVDVFEKLSDAGGMLTHIIPEFRLPKAPIEREFKGLFLPGINFHFSKELGKDITIAQLSESYNAVFLAPGLWSGRKLEIPGIETVDHIDALSLLKAYRETGACKLKDNVLIIGGGSVAADVAMTAKKCGAKKITMVCLESETEMPALPSEVKDLKSQGVSVLNCWGPKAFVGKNELSCKYCTSVFDKQGKFHPSFDESKLKELEFDQIIIAIGQGVESDLAAYLKKEFGSTMITVNNETQLIAGKSNLYAGGDITRGAGTVVQAVADGRRAAMAIDASLKKNA
ncbi:MAG: FAD-dependent oxidoreductase, partial [Candidatus Helarchaeota archaeon]|nr:FAD-dependent oxidoreductase [Candidatus Helarchaeota archaeon]